MMAKVISVFDGMACGYIAMLLNGIQIERYVAFEIDKYATKTAKHNFPDIEEMGDVFEADFTQYEGFDFLVGGSPCTYWSIAQTKNRETVASGMGWELFQQYVRALREVKPKYFIYENNKSMSKDIRASITDAFGFEPVCINSALVSAQNRQRLYWCGVRNEDGSYRPALIFQPDDRGIVLRDILETSSFNPLSEKEMDYMVRDHLDQRWNFCNKPGEEEKSKCLVANVCKGVPYNLVAEPINACSESEVNTLMRPYGAKGKISTPDDKTHSLLANSGGGNGCYVAETIQPLSEQAMDYMLRSCKDGRNHFDFGYTFDVNKDKSPCVTTGVGRIPYGVVAEPVCVAQRERYPESSSEVNTEQMYEAREDAKSNALTTVSKNNLVADPVYAITSMPRDKWERNHARYLEQEKANNSYERLEVCVPVPECFWNKDYPELENHSKENGENCLQTSCPFFLYCGNVKAPIYEVRDGLITVKGKQYPIKLVDGYYIIRKLTVKECMRLQTVPDWYEFPVSNSQAYKMLGNGWTVEVIRHLLDGLMKEEM